MVVLNRAMNPPQDAGKPVLPRAFKVRGRASVNFRHAVQSAYEKIPAHLREQAEKAGVRVAIGHVLPEIDRNLLPERPRGWPPELGWGDVPAAYVPVTKTIAIAECAEGAPVRATRTAYDLLTFAEYCYVFCVK